MKPRYLWHYDYKAELSCWLSLLCPVHGEGKSFIGWGGTRGMTREPTLPPPIQDRGWRLARSSSLEFYLLVGEKYSKNPFSQTPFYPVSLWKQQCTLAQEEMGRPISFGIPFSIGKHPLGRHRARDKEEPWFSRFGLFCHPYLSYPCLRTEPASHHLFFFFSFIKK